MWTLIKNIREKEHVKFHKIKLSRKIAQAQIQIK